MDEQQLQEQIVQLVQAAMQGDQQAAQQIEQIMQAAQQGDQQAAQIAQLIQEVAQQLQGQQVQAAKFGAKLNYIRTLRGECPFGTEPQYFRSGGKVCKRCVRKGQNGMAPKDPVTEFKTVSAKCGKKMRKKDCGGTVRKAQEGALIAPRVPWGWSYNS